MVTAGRSASVSSRRRGRHHRRPAHRPGQHRVVQQDPHRRRTLLVEQALPTDTQLDPPVDLGPGQAGRTAPITALA